MSCKRSKSPGPPVRWPAVIDYIDLESSPNESLMRIMNDERVREHLIGHRTFTVQLLEEWIGQKSEMARRDSGCRIRGILVNREYAGWCGVQREDDDTYGLGLILDPKYWGVGKAVFEDMVQWCRELGHQEVFIHLLSTRPVSKALMRRLDSVCETVEMEGRTFRRYRVLLSSPAAP